MITFVRVRNLRGIRDGQLADMRAITILLGANGSGKSAILDALLIAGSPDSADAVGRAVRRRVSASTGGRWLLWRSGAAGDAVIEAHATWGVAEVTVAAPVIATEPSRADPRGDYELLVTSTSTVDGAGRDDSARVVFQYDGGSSADPTRYRVVREPRNNPPPRYLRMIDPAPGSNQADLARVFSGVKEGGRRLEAERLLREVVPDFEQLDLLIDDNDRPVVGISYGGAEPRTVPVALAGDGVLVLTRVALELSGCPAGVALIEEPEVHQHPRSLRRVAEAIVTTAARDVQVILTTHSEEFVRMLLEAAQGRAMLNRTAVFNVKLDSGTLRSSTLAGDDALLAIDAFGDDLR